VSGVPEASTPDSRQTGVTADGTAEAVAAVPQPERGSDEVRRNLGRLEHLESGRNAAAGASVRLRWLA
jgi:hypothetical protein